MLAVGDLSLDPARGRCARGGSRIDLTAREFAVLEFLMRRAGEVVSKAEILDGVWDFAFDGDPNIVEVYIAHLRAKIDRPFGRTSIETLRGAGYRSGRAMAEPGATLHRRAGIRLRITAVAASVVALALLVGAVAFWLTLRTALYGELGASAEQDAAAFAEQVDQAGVEALPDLDDDRFWQVIDRDSGAVVAASDAAEDLGALADRDGGAPALVYLEEGEPPFVTAADREGGDIIVVAGRSSDSADATLGTVAVLLAIGVPLIAGIVAATTWLAVGRALAPVERMRREVEAVTSTDLHRRVADPGTADELGRLAHTMNGMLARLEEGQAAQRRFISDASHELKSPLASLRQYAEVARDHPDRITADELSEAVLDEGGRLERLVQGMLVLTRADEGALALHVTDVDLDDLLFAEAGGCARPAGSTWTPAPSHRCGCAAISPSCVRRCATCPTTRHGTRGGGWRSRRGTTRHPPSSPSTTTAPASHRPSASASSSGSCGSTRRGRGMPAAAAWGSPSSGRSCAATGAPSASWRARSAAPGSRRAFPSEPDPQGRAASGWLQGRRDRLGSEKRRTPCANAPSGPHPPSPQWHSPRGERPSPSPSRTT